MGDRAEDWLRFRTVPLVVSLNVAELIEGGDEHPGLLGLDDAIVAVEARYNSWDDDEEFAACERDVEVVTEKYSDGYPIYAGRFTRAVEAAAAEIGLPVRVTVRVDDDPQSSWWATETAVTNPAKYDGDQLILQLWSSVHDTVPLPNVDVRLGG